MDISRSKSLHLKALRMMLRPIVRFGVRGSSTLQEFVSIAKVLFVEVAVEEMERKEIKINMNRLSLTTGVHRKDVREIFKENRKDDELAQSTSSRVTSHWSQSKHFTTKNGRPRVLTYKGEENEFRELCWQVNRHLSPKTVLLELERLGLVEKSARGLKLSRDIDVNYGDEEKRLSLLARNMESLIDASNANTNPYDEIGHLHMRTEYDNIFVKDLPKIRTWIMKEGKAFHQKVRKFVSRYDSDVQPNAKKESGARVVVGAFSMSTDPTAELED